MPSGFTSQIAQRAQNLQGYVAKLHEENKNYQHEIQQRNSREVPSHLTCKLLTFFKLPLMNKL